MLGIDMTIADALENNIRVNVSNKTVEIYNEYGVCMRLTNLKDYVYEAFKTKYQNY